MEKQEGKNYKWLLLGLLAFTYFLMHATRQIFNASLPDIKASLPGTSDAQWGFTRTAFLFAYGLAVPLAGIAADMLRRKWVVVVGAFLFSASVLGTGFVDGFVGMLIMYGLMNGIGQCMIPASSSSLIAQYHHETRSTALSIYQTGLYFGIIVSSVLAGFLGAHSQEGWRWAFWGFGALGVVWTVILCIFMRDTPPLIQNHRAGELERAGDALVDTGIDLGRDLLPAVAHEAQDRAARQLGDAVGLDRHVPYDQRYPQPSRASRAAWPMTGRFIV